MALNNLRDLSTQWIVAGLLLTSMIAFSISFMYNNSDVGFDDDSEYMLSTQQTDSMALLESMPQDSDKLLNTTANTNPEISDLGSRDSVSTSYDAFGTSRQTWDSTKTMMSWIFSGAIGKMLLTVIGGLLGLIAYFLIAKHIRTGD